MYAGAAPLLSLFSVWEETLTLIDAYDTEGCVVVIVVMGDSKSLAQKIVYYIRLRVLYLFFEIISYWDSI